MNPATMMMLAQMGMSILGSLQGNNVPREVREAQAMGLRMMKRSRGNPWDATAGLQSAQMQGLLGERAAQAAGGLAANGLSAEGLQGFQQGLLGQRSGIDAQVLLDAIQRKREEFSQGYGAVMQGAQLGMQANRGGGGNEWAQWLYKISELAAKNREQAAANKNTPQTPPAGGAAAAMVNTPLGANLIGGLPQPNLFGRWPSKLILDPAQDQANDELVRRIYEFFNPRPGMMNFNQRF